MQSESVLPRPVMVREVPIALCQFLKLGGLTASGGEAKMVIHAGQVRLNGTIETQKRKKLAVGDHVTFNGLTLVVQLA